MSNKFMKKSFEIKDKTIIHAMMSNAEYGTLALCSDETPYSVPVNFVHIKDIIYFHGSLGGRKMKTLRANPKVSFSIVENFSIIPSYFSATDALACPATQFFKSINIDGEVSIIENKDEKIKALSLLMQKLQPEGGYKAFEDDAYEKILNATAILKIEIKSLRAKFKFGQHLSPERFDMILSNLKKRNSNIDQLTIDMMKKNKVLSSL